MTTNELRKKFLEFFKEKGHSIIPSASLIPEDDPSVLFTTAGMHPLVPFLRGEKHPAGKRLANVQKCIRTSDIDEVGNSHHLTFFEMLGNWSLGDYWKKEAVEWSWEFLTSKKWLGLEPQKIAISVFKGDKNCPFDQESYDLWLKIGIPAERIAKLDKTKNWWPAGGESIGPQGPDTEMFYWTGKEEVPKKFDPSDEHWFEIWNDVFMEFGRTADGKYKPLKQKSVDTGMGLERTVAVLQNKKSIYEIETFKPLMEQIKSMAKDYQEEPARIIVDHLRSAVFIMADDLGIVPSNLDQGYVVRKLIRRAIRHAKKIGIPLKTDVTTPIVELVVGQFKDVYPELSKNKQRVIDELNKEEGGFEKTLEKGLKKLTSYHLDKKLTGVALFKLFTTDGFPLEMSLEIAKEKNIKLEPKAIEVFEKLMDSHKEKSRTSSAGMFKGGLVEKSEKAIKYHTATHLLHQALREVLGSHVEQRGSNITEKRLRFDFSHLEKMTDKEKQRIEEIINQKIKENLPVCVEEISVEEAKKRGAIGLFGDKYGDKVKVYTIGDFSKEICGGPHIESTGSLGRFKIKKEEASSRGVRRIKAILE